MASTSPEPDLQFRASCGSHAPRYVVLVVVERAQGGNAYGLHRGAMPAAREIQFESLLGDRERVPQASEGTG